MLFILPSIAPRIECFFLHYTVCHISIAVKVQAPAPRPQAFLINSVKQEITKLINKKNEAAAASKAEQSGGQLGVVKAPKEPAKDEKKAVKARPTQM